MEGLIDTDVPAVVADHVMAVLAEALSNVARHARAHAAEVSLVVGSGTLTRTVSDDGVGFPGTGAAADWPTSRCAPGSRAER